jgi:uncharacterized protein YrrD
MASRRHGGGSSGSESDGAERYRDGTPVFSRDGSRIGEVAGVVVDPIAGEVTEVLVDTGVVAGRKRLVDAAAVAEATADRVVVFRSDDLVPFEERRYVPIDESWRRRVSPGTRRAMLPYRPFEHIPPYPAHFVAKFDRTRVTDRNIPDGTIAIETGIDVVSADDRRLGRVAEILTADDSMTGFVIEKGVFLKAERAVPIGWVRSLGESAIRLGVAAETVERLPIYTG